MASGGSRASAIYDLYLEDKSAQGREEFIASLGEVEAAVGKLVVGGFASLAATGAAAFTTLYVMQEPVIRQMGETSKELGINLVAWQAFERAANLANVSVESLTSSMDTGLRSIEQAAVGAGNARYALQAIGIESQKLQQLAPEERINAVLKALEGIQNISTRIEYAEKIFGGAGAEIIRIAADDITDAADEMERLGIALEQADVENLAVLSNEIQKFTSLGSTAAQQFLSAMTPAILAVINTTYQWGEANGDVRQSMIGLADTTITVIGWIGDRVNDLRRFWTGLEFSFQNMGTQMLILMDKIPGLDLGDKIREEFNKGIDIYEKYLSIDENGKFSEKLKQNLIEVRENAEGAAKAIRDSQTEAAAVAAAIERARLKALSGEGAAANDPLSEEGGDSIEIAVEKAIERERLKAERIEEYRIKRQEYQLERIRRFGMDEFEILEEDQERTAAFLDGIAERDKSRAEEVANIRTAANQSYHDKYIKLLQDRADSTINRERDMMEAGRTYITKGIEHFAASSEVADALHKALTARRMFREGREAVIGAYKFGNSLGGPALGSVFAGIAIAYTGALIAEAVGGSGGGASAPGSSAVSADTTTGDISGTESTTEAYTGPQTIVYNAYFTRNIPESERGRLAAQQFEDEVKANRILIGDNTNVQFNQFDYEEYGT